MGTTDRNLIVDKSASKRHKKKLKTILSSFFDFLGRTPKPSNEEVRAEFMKSEMDWKAYCVQNKLDIRTSLLFNAKVSYEWEHRNVKKLNM